MSLTRLIIFVCILPAFMPTRLSAQKLDSSLLKARADFKTTLARETRDSDSVAPPPPELFSLIKYPTSIGDISAYLSKADASNKKQPAIIWLSGGFPADGIAHIYRICIAGLQSSWQSR